MIQIYSNSNNVIVGEDQLAICLLNGIQEGKRINGRKRLKLNSVQCPKLGFWYVWLVLKTLLLFPFLCWFVFLNYAMTWRGEKINV